MPQQSENVRSDGGRSFSSFRPDAVSLPTNIALPPPPPPFIKLPCEQLCGSVLPTWVADTSIETASRDVMAKVSRPSNKGGPAARQGFKYQDHVAASFILKMLADSNYVQVECETADDIVAVYYQGETLINEYIQVKTTEDDKKWNLDQSTKLDNRKPDTSLFQKSLLCDKRPGDARFRIVSKRDVANVLRCFTVELEKRVLPDEATSRGSKLAKKFPKTLSDQKHDFNYWADNFVWQVCGAMGSMEAMNMTLLFELAEQQGMRPNHSQCKKIYAEFLEWADEAATANVITEAANKVITREQAGDRLEALFQDAERDAASNAKPYRTKPEPFLVEFHSASDASLLRSLTGFDIQYDFEDGNVVSLPSTWFSGFQNSACVPAKSPISRCTIPEKYWLSQSARSMGPHCRARGFLLR